MNMLRDVCPDCRYFVASMRAHKKYCSAKKDHCEKYEPADPKDVVLINGKYFKYDCTRKHEHGGNCLTDDMVNELSEIIYEQDKKTIL
jgi:hypothetical protein